MTIRCPKAQADPALLESPAEAPAGAAGPGCDGEPSFHPPMAELPDGVAQRLACFGELSRLQDVERDDRDDDQVERCERPMPHCSPPRRSTALV